MRRASRGRFERPVSWREVSGTTGALMVGVMVDCEGWEAVAAEVCWVEGEGAEWPFVWGMSPFVSAMVKVN